MAKSLPLKSLSPLPPCTGTVVVRESVALKYAGALCRFALACVVCVVAAVMAGVVGVLLGLWATL